MRTIFKVFLVNVFFLTVHIKTCGQKQDFTKNVVKIKGQYAGAYGFITALDKDAKAVYFVRILKDKRFNEQLRVLTNSGKSSTSATLVQPVFQIAGYYIGIYKIDGTVAIETKYFRATPAKSSSYFLLNDQNRGNPDAIAAKVSRRDVSPERIGNKNIVSQSISFETDEPGEFGLGGTPITDADGYITAILAEDQEITKSLIPALDITSIQSALEELGRKSGKPCLYFNLIQQGAFKDENTCQHEERLAKEEAQQKKDAEERRIKELKQENLKNVFEAYWAGSKDNEVKKIYNKNRDRFFAMSIGATGSLNVLSLSTATSGSTEQTIGSAYGYSVGANVYVNPDKHFFRLVFKPRYSSASLGINADYKYNSTIDFKFKKINYTSFELPVLLEFVTKRMENGDNFFSLGYGVAKHLSNDFSYTTATADSKDPVPGYTSNSQHALLEIGSSRSRVRYSVLLRYQTTPFARKDYEFILDRQSVYPFRDVSKHYWTLGLDLQFRLWNRWNNDYRTMR